MLQVPAFAKQIIDATVDANLPIALTTLLGTLREQSAARAGPSAPAGHPDLDGEFASSLWATQPTLFAKTRLLESNQPPHPSEAHK